VTRASIVVPTHDTPTLDLAVASALAQTEPDLEVVIVGDGVAAGTREVAEALARDDERVRFFDLPKGEHHGEVHRDRIVRDELRSPVAFYLCDDDLLFPDHVATLLGLLDDADLVNSMNGYLDVEGRFVPHFSDLESDEHRRWLMAPDQNSVSVTGTAHRVETYRRLPVGWQPPPPGRWTDHLLWQKLLALPGVRAVTSSKVTALQVPTHLDGRDRWEPARRRAELEQWWQVVSDPVQRLRLEEAIVVGLNRHGARTQEALSGCVRQVRALELANHGLEAAAVATAADLAATQVELRSAGDRIHDLEHHLALIEGSRVWRLRSRILRGPLRRLVRGSGGARETG
jgi:hypothetical protein